MPHTRLHLARRTCLALVFGVLSAIFVAWAAAAAIPASERWGARSFFYSANEPLGARGMVRIGWVASTITLMSPDSHWPSRLQRSGLDPSAIRSWNPPRYAQAMTELRETPLADANGAKYTVWAFGAPMRCLAFATRRRNEVDAQTEPAAGCLSAMWFPWRTAECEYLPVRVIWSGAAVDSLTWGTLWFGVLVGPTLFTTWLRTRRGNCPCCGYDTRRLFGRCPECGAPRRNRSTGK